MTEWLNWVRRLQSIAQAGLTYGHDAFDKERYLQIQQIAAEIATAATSGDFESIHGLYQNETGYSTPKVDVRGAVVRDGKILLIQIRADRRWAMPGGWADLGNSPASVAEREVWEESG